MTWIEPNKVYAETLLLNADPEDFRMLVYRYQGLLLSYLRGRMRDRFEVEEAVQRVVCSGFHVLEKASEAGIFSSMASGHCGTGSQGTIP